MATREISIRVSDRAARAYENASDDIRRKLDALLSLRLTEVTRSERSLEEIITELGKKAKERGLTQEKLDEIQDADE